MPVVPLTISTTNSMGLVAKITNIHIPDIGFPQKSSLKRMKGLEHVYFDGT
jgi:hypothetical protein